MADVAQNARMAINKLNTNGAMQEETVSSETCCICFRCHVRRQHLLLLLVIVVLVVVVIVVAAASAAIVVIADIGQQFVGLANLLLFCAVAVVCFV